MKIVRFVSGAEIGYGIIEGEVIKGIAGIGAPDCLAPTGKQYPAAEVKLLAPCTPSKIVAVGLNYRSHALEVKMKLPEEPLIFLKPSTSVIGPEDDIVYPPASKQVDFEAELGVVIKKTARQVSEAASLDSVLGYTCFNDVTARDFQRSDTLWTRAKGFDTFAAIGPHIETELDPSNVNVESYLNGERRQNGNSSDIIFDVPALISHISHIMTLLPGDVIATGTPSGIGPMQPGDTIEVKVAGIGTLRNRVAAA